MMKRNAYVSALYMILGLMIVAGCGRPAENQHQEGSAQSIEIRGSDTMTPVGAAWAEGFREAHPDAEVSVTGGGSGTGFKALIEGNIDIATASRAIKDKEVQLAEQNGITPVEHIVGMDGIAVVVNQDNPVEELTLEQIKKIYIGQITNWNQVGGPDEEIVVVSRDSSSGTYAFFQEHVMDSEDYRTDARALQSNAQIADTIVQDATSIGYVGVAFAEERPVKILGVKMDEGSDAVLPSNPTVQSKEYPISRPLYLYTAGEPAGMVAEFMNYVKGAAGQQKVEEQGYVPLP